MNTDTIQAEKLMSINDYVKKHGVSRRTVYNMISDGRLETKEFFGRQLIVIGVDKK